MDWDLIPRIIATAGCVFALWILALDARRFRKKWNVKTQDHWLALSMWVFVGLTGSVEAVTRGIDVGATTVIKFLAIALTLRALLRRGEVAAVREKAPWKKED